MSAYIRIQPPGLFAGPILVTLWVTTVVLVIITLLLANGVRRELRRIATSTTSTKVTAASDG